MKYFPIGKVTNSIYQTYIWDEDETYILYLDLTKSVIKKQIPSLRMTNNGVIKSKVKLKTVPVNQNLLLLNSELIMTSLSLSHVERYNELNNIDVISKLVIKRFNNKNAITKAKLLNIDPLKVVEDEIINNSVRKDYKSYTRTQGWIDIVSEIRSYKDNRIEVYFHCPYDRVLLENKTSQGIFMHSKIKCIDISDCDLITMINATGAFNGLKYTEKIIANFNDMKYCCAVKNMFKGDRLLNFNKRQLKALSKIIAKVYDESIFTDCDTILKNHRHYLENIRLTKTDDNQINC